jgi:hypothetical protein
LLLHGTILWLVRLIEIVLLAALSVLLDLFLFFRFELKFLFLAFGYRFNERFIH